jgi:hypothetical protein
VDRIGIIHEFVIFAATRGGGGVHPRVIMIEASLDSS